jgi:serine/threonine protein kinase
MSISADELAQGGRRITLDPVSANNPSPAFNFAPGSMVADRYRVVSLLGRGGMGEFYGADDLKLGQRVALKFLPKSSALLAARWSGRRRCLPCNRDLLAVGRAKRLKRSSDKV